MWVYVSPHLDDVVYSCGAVIWSQMKAGEYVEIWTLCAGDPPSRPLSPYARSLHERWKTGLEAVSVRRAEDVRACGVLGAAYRHFSIPDCIYRRDPDRGDALYQSDTAIFGDVDPVESGLINSLADEISGTLPEGANLVAPMGIGGHVDHQIVVSVLKKMRVSNHSTSPVKNPLSLWRYADVPYVLSAPASLQAHVRPEWRPEKFPAPEPAQRAWVEAMACYKSQLSSFWPNAAVMREKIAAYIERLGGVFLWRE